MNIDDIRSGIRHRDTGAMRACFHALVAPDEHVEGFADGAEDAILLLRDLAEALRLDPEPMPAPLAAAVRAQADDDLPEASYGAGASAVRANLPRWHTVLADRFPASTMGE